MDKTYKVYKIENGTVIDHIPHSKALKVIDILGYKDEGLIAIGINLSSEKMGKKDLIKYENKVLKKEETDKLALIAPEATINIIKDSKVIEKRKITIPEELIDIVKCQNPNCITNIENLSSKLILIDEKNRIYRCYYCEREFKVTPDMIK